MKEYGDTRHAELVHENELEGRIEKVSMTNFDIAVSVSNLQTGEAVDVSGHFEWAIWSYEYSSSVYDTK